MYIRNFLACITLLASSSNLLYASPCYTDTAGVCAEDKNIILVKTNTSATGEVCTEYTNEFNNKIAHCYTPKVGVDDPEGKVSVELKQKTPMKEPPVTINNITYNTVYNQPPPLQEEAPAIQSARDIYWQGYFQGYSNQSFYGQGHGHRPHRPYRPHHNNNHKQLIIGRPFGKNNRSSISNAHMNNSRAPVYERPSHSNRPIMRPPNSNRGPVRGYR